MFCVRVEPDSDVGKRMFYIKLLNDLKIGKAALRMTNKKEIVRGFGSEGDSLK